jgi:hypothetical protein
MFPEHSEVPELPTRKLVSGAFAAGSRAAFTDPCESSPHDRQVTVKSRSGKHVGRLSNYPFSSLFRQKKTIFCYHFFNFPGSRAKNGVFLTSW